MNICFCINDSYTDILCVCIFSILQNNKDEEINFYILSSDLSQKSKNKLNKFQELYYNCKILFKNIDGSIFQDLKLNIKYISIETYFRYIIADVFPELDKILYLDADTVINGSIEKLYNTDLEDFYCVGVNDICIERLGYKQNIGFKEDEVYVNAGVLLLNLKELRKNKISKELIEKTTELEGVIYYQDQDVINIVFKNKIKTVDSIYNFCNDNVRLEKEKRNSAIIVHYTGRKKPWNYKCKNELKRVWRKYCKQCVREYLSEKKLIYNYSPFKNFYHKYFQSICETIFSVKNYKWTHKTVTILGIKINFLRSRICQIKKQNPYYYCKKHNVDITKIPPATGQIRDIQLANLALLREMDYVCKENNLTYWLDGGTLIGAVRHKGFIPWDDDIDTAMLREDYEKIIDAFKKSSRNPDIYADYYRQPNLSCSCFIKVQHKKCPHLFVDIFPWDYYGNILTIPEQIEKSKEIKEIIADLENRTNKCMSNAEILRINRNTMKNTILAQNDSNNYSNGDLVWGIDFHHVWNNWFTQYDVLYPIRTITFEGYEFPCMNNPDAFLTRLYGNYMNYPRKIYYGHNMYKYFDNNQKVAIKNLIESFKDND